jgi:hypothetical protein
MVVGMAEVNWEDQVAGAGGRLGHSPIPTGEDGHGPVAEQEALGYSCSCGSRTCGLDMALKAAWRAGIRLAALAWPLPEPPPAVTIEPEQLDRLLADAGAQRR